MPRNQGIGRTGKKHKKSANDNIHRQPKATTEPTVATEAPEPPAEPHNESEMEVEPAAPDQTANRLLLMTAEHEAAMAALRLTPAAKQADAESEEEIEIKEKMAALTRRVDDYRVRVGDTRRPKGLFGSTVAAKAVLAAADLAGRTRAGFGASTTSSSHKRPRWSTSGAGWPAAGKNPGFSWRISGPL